MPVYEYKCNRGHHYELTQGFDAPTRQRCPECGASARRQISLPAVIFKGPGFHNTDYRKSNGASSDSTPSSASASSSDDHGDSHDGGDSKVETATTAD